MYTPSFFREERPEALLEAIARYPLATLVTLGSDGLQSSQVPLLYEVQDGTRGILRGHLARANPQWRNHDPNVAALALFHGPQHYVSPSWYPSKSEHGMVVPTWNYMAIEAQGLLKVIEDRDQVLNIVRKLTETHERRSANPWSVDDAPADYIDRMLTSIVGIEIAVDRLEGKWKMSQNRSKEDRLGIAAGLRGIGSAESLAVADLVE